MLDDLGADGVALLTNQAGIHQGDSRLDPLGAELNHRDAAVFVHPTVAPGDRTPGPAKGSRPE